MCCNNHKLFGSPRTCQSCAFTLMMEWNQCPSCTSLYYSVKVCCASLTRGHARGKYHLWNQDNLQAAGGEQGDAGGNIKYYKRSEKENNKSAETTEMARLTHKRLIHKTTLTILTRIRMKWAGLSTLFWRYKVGARLVLSMLSVKAYSWLPVLHSFRRPRCANSSSCHSLLAGYTGKQSTSKHQGK